MNKFSREELEKILKQAIVDGLGCPLSEIKNDSSLVELGLDSLDTIELIMDLESQLDIEIENDEAEQLAAKSVKELLDALETHCGAIT